ncbi:MAG TPA: ester cyclase [Kofleriaceae bacterium]
MSDANKAVVRRFNQDVIERLDRAAFDAIMAPDFVNRTAPPGMPPGPESMWNTFANVLHPALADLTVEIHEQVAERDLVTTRKTIRGTRHGDFLGAAPTGKLVEILVIDMVRVRGGQYAEHWGLNTLQQVVAQLKQGA